MGLDAAAPQPVAPEYPGQQKSEMSQTYTNLGQRRHGLALAIAIAIALVAPATAFADAVTYWNEKAATPITTAGGENFASISRSASLRISSRLQTSP